jgi:hypothetical protein
MTTRKITNTNLVGMWASGFVASGAMYNFASGATAFGVTLTALAVLNLVINRGTKQ